MSQAATVSTKVILPERCETCARWGRYAGQNYGRCGKKGWRTPAGDWCRYFTQEEITADATR